MKKKIVFPVLLFLALGVCFSLVSCSKTEGEGGRATLSGRVKTTVVYKDYSTVIDEYYKADEDVFIIYGNDVTYSDRTRTDYNGYYRFDYLRPGEYTLFVYGDDVSGLEPSGMTTEIQTVNISGKKDEISLSDFEIARVVEFDDGNSSICGKVWKVDYNSTFTSILGEFYAPDEWIYLIYENEISYCERVRSGPGGSFCFDNLIKGSYQVYVYSDDSTGTVEAGFYAVIKDVDITDYNQTKFLPDFRILD